MSKSFVDIFNSMFTGGSPEDNLYYFLGSWGIKIDRPLEFNAELYTLMDEFLDRGVISLDNRYEEV